MYQDNSLDSRKYEKILEFTKNLSVISLSFNKVFIVVKFERMI